MCGYIVNLGSRAAISGAGQGASKTTSCTFVPFRRKKSGDTVIMKVEIGVNA